MKVLLFTCYLKPNLFYTPLTNNILVLRLALKGKKDKSTGVDESIVAKINEIAEKAGERPDVIMAEYKKRFAEYMKRDGITESKASIVTIKSIVFQSYLSPIQTQLINELQYLLLSVFQSYLSPIQTDMEMEE